MDSLAYHLSSKTSPRSGFSLLALDFLFIFWVTQFEYKDIIFLPDSYHLEYPFTPLLHCHYVMSLQVFITSHLDFGNHLLHLSALNTLFTYILISLKYHFRYFDCFPLSMAEIFHWCGPPVDHRCASASVSWAIGSASLDWDSCRVQTARAWGSQWATSITHHLHTHPHLHQFQVLPF